MTDEISWFDKSNVVLSKLCDALTTCACALCCKCWNRDKPVSATQRIHIHHTCLEQQPQRPHGRLDSTGSNTDSVKSYTYRDRVDSDNSRTDSISSASGISTDSKRHITPYIDVRPIEFWTANRENVQPRTKRRLPSESEISIDNFQKDLYETDADEEPCLTDEEKLEQFQLGQLHFGLHYDITQRLLVVKMIEAKDLPPPYCMDERKQDMAHSNPYCKISLLPDQKASQQTTVQRKTQEPFWNECFSFEIDPQEAQERTLEILLKDFDKFSRHRLIGKVLLPLCSVNFIKGGHMWKPLAPGNKECLDLGELLLSINYLPSAGRLTIDVIKAKGLLQTDMMGGADPFTRVTLVQNEKPIKTKKTSCKRNTIDPVFNESVSFNLTPQQLLTASIVLSIWDHNSKLKDDFVGRVVIGKYASGSQEAKHWDRMLQAQRSPVAQWHSLRSRAECDQVSVASIAVP